MNDKKPKSPQETSNIDAKHEDRTQSVQVDEEKEQTNISLSGYKRKFANTRSIKSFDRPTPQPKDDD